MILTILRTLQDVAEGQPAHHTSLNVNATAFEVPGGGAASGSPSAPMAFGPGGAYFLTGASTLSTGPASDAAAAGYGLAGSDNSAAAAGQRSASLPAYLPKSFSAAPYAANMPGLDEGALIVCICAWSMLSLACRLSGFAWQAHRGKPCLVLQCARPKRSTVGRGIMCIAV